MAATTATAAHTHPRPPRRPAGPGRPRRAPWLGLVAVAYAVVQLAVVVPHTTHALGWDESVYASQVDPRAPAAYFSAPRSRGISVLVAPAVAVTSSPLMLRLYFVLLSAAALYGAFRVWRRLFGEGTVAFAALLFAGLWITQISGPAVMPNLWVALGALAAVGWFLRVPGEPRARWWLAALVAGVTLVRTPDGMWLALPLLLTAVCARARRRALPALLAGLATGVAQWVIEAYVRFGGIHGRMRVSSDVEGGMGAHLNVGAAWRSLNGPQLCRPCEVPLEHPELTIWWLALPLLSAAAVAAAVRDHRRTRPGPLPGLAGLAGLIPSGSPLRRLGALGAVGPVDPRGHAAPGGRAAGTAGHADERLAATLLPLACAVSLAVPYLFLISFSAPRFLLPAYALLSVPLAALALRVVRSDRSPGRAAVILGAIVALQLGSQHSVLWSSVDQTERVTRQYERAAHGLRGLGLEPPCLVVGSRAQPVAYRAGCDSEQTAGNNRSITPAALLRRAAAEPTALIAGGPRERPPAYARDWTPHRLPGMRWIAYLPPKQVLPEQASSPRRTELHGQGREILPESRKSRQQVSGIDESMRP